MESNFEKKIIDTESVENKKELERKEKLKNVYESLFERELFPLQVLQGSKIIDLTADKELYGVTSNRPFIVLEAGKIGKIDENGKMEKVIYKEETETLGPFQSIKKEEIIYRDILPEIHKNLPENIKKQVCFPKLIESIKRDGETKAIILEKIDGIICGDYNKTKKDIWDKKDIETICCVIKEFQEIDPEKLRKDFPELPESDFFEIYIKELEKYIEPVKKMLGEEYVIKMKELLAKRKEIIPKQPTILFSEDVACFNTIKMPDGKLGFIDWERPYVSKDASADYGRFISKLWTVPELQEEAIKITLKLNKDNPYFKDMFRASTVLYEGAITFHRYFKKLESDNPQEREEAGKVVKVFKKLFKDTLDNKGVWQEKI